MLQTLLHAIELKNQEAASDKDEDKKTKVGQRSVVHTIEFKNQEAASDKDVDKKTKVGQRSEIHTKNQEVASYKLGQRAEIKGEFCEGEEGNGV